jgi:hypothetical protein
MKRYKKPNKPWRACRKLKKHEEPGKPLKVFTFSDNLFILQVYFKSFLLVPKNVTRLLKVVSSESAKHIHYPSSIIKL